MPQNPLFGLQKASSISGPPPDQGIDPRYDPATGEFHADPNWRNTGEQSILQPGSPLRNILEGGGDAALGGLKRVAQIPKNIWNFATKSPNDPSQLAGPATGEDMTPAVPPIPPSAPTTPRIGAGYTPRLSGAAASQPGAVDIPTPELTPSIDDQIRAHSSFGTMGTPGDTAALSLHQTQQDPNIALEGLQNARKSEMEDRATQLLKTGNPRDAAESAAWGGQAARYAGDLANPSTPLNKMRVAEAADTAAQQQGFGIPPGQPPSPSQQAGAFQRSLESQQVGNPLAVAKETTSRDLGVANLNIQAAKDRDAATLAAMRANPYQAISFDKSGASVKPMTPNQMTPSGPLGVADQKAYTIAIQRARDLRTPLSGAYAMAYAQSQLPGGKPLAVAQKEADEDVARYKTMLTPGAQGGAINPAHQQALQGQRPGKYTMTDGSVLIVGPDGSITRGQ